VNGLSLPPIFFYQGGFNSTITPAGPGFYELTLSVPIAEPVVNVNLNGLPGYATVAITGIIITVECFDPAGNPFNSNFFVSIFDASHV
jgi:hypothetical protein